MVANKSDTSKKQESRPCSQKVSADKVDQFLEEEEQKLDKLLEKIQQESPPKVSSKKLESENNINNLFEQHLDSYELKKEMDKLRLID